MKLNASLINKWMDCPLQAKFRYIDGIKDTINSKATFGTCIHEALDRYNKGDSIDSCIERFKYTWSNPKILNAEPDYWISAKGNDFGSLRELGIQILKEYDENLKWDGREVIASEHRFCVPFGDHELSGIVDLLEVKKSGSKKILRIVDYKTAGKQPTKLELQSNIQFTIYYYASLQREFWTGYKDYEGIPNGENLWESFRKTERKAIWYHLMKNKEIFAGPREDGDFYRLYTVVEQIDKAMKAEVYVPNISASSCTFCSYIDECETMIPVIRSLNEQNVDIRAYS